VPLSRIQIDTLRLLAAHRDPESYVAGSTPLNLHELRYSGDIDVFHDREERVSRSAEEDTALLQAHGYDVEWQRREPTIYTVVVKRGGEQTKLEWVVDSDYRFFPTMKDEMFGYVLHPVDLAMNKVLAAAGRREVRDIVDTVTIHRSILSLGAVIWAAVDKAPGFTPEGLISEIRRNSSYPVVEWRALTASQPLDPGVIMGELRTALEEAETFVGRMPTEKAGLLFLKDGVVVQPDPSHLDDYQTHAGQRRGQWPTSGEISRAMLERYNQGPLGNDPRL
jgi:hypothetical protein